MGVSKTSNHIKIKIKMPNPSEEPPVSSKAPNEDLKDIGVICTYKNKIENPKVGHGVSTTLDHIQIKIKMPKPS